MSRLCFRKDKKVKETGGERTRIVGEETGETGRLQIMKESEVRRQGVSFLISLIF